MIRRVALFLIVVLDLTSTAQAEELRDVVRPCRVERLDTAYAACVNLIADTRDLALENAIAQTLSGLQAATGPELRAITKRYENAQGAWRQAVAFGCNRAFPDEPRPQADCRLQAVLSRNAQLSTSLERLSYDLGGPETINIPVPDEVEVLLPLPPGMTGPRRRVRVPLTVPILP